MSLVDPTDKMSKSDPNINSRVMMTDDNDTIIRKFKRAVTDSGNQIIRGEGKEGITNLITIMSVMTKRDPKEIENEFIGKMYGEFKVAVAEAVIAVVEPIRTIYQDLLKDKTYLDSVLLGGKQAATLKAEKVIERVKTSIGL